MLGYNNDDYGKTNPAGSSFMGQNKLGLIGLLHLEEIDKNDSVALSGNGTPIPKPENNQSINKF